MKVASEICFSFSVAEEVNGITPKKKWNVIKMPQWRKKQALQVLV